VQGAGARFERTLLQQVAGFVLSRYPFPHDNPFVNQFFNLLFGGRQRPDGLFEFVTRQCWQTDQSVMAHRFHLLQQFDLGERLDCIRVPTLVLTGDRDVLVSSSSLDAVISPLSCSPSAWHAKWNASSARSNRE
jgi:pimeloyl-ACP methyl ester carboxylesterase